jgi:hypothetical protein
MARRTRNRPQRDQKAKNALPKNTRTLMADPSDPLGSCDEEESGSEVDTETYGPHRLRKGETVLQARTARILLVLEQCHDSFNHQVRFTGQTIPYMSFKPAT